MTDPVTGLVFAVTGGTGFLGRRIVSELVARGASVRMLARTPWASGNPRGSSITAVAGRLEDTESLDEWVRGADRVIHAAAVVGSIDVDVLRRTNIDGTRNALGAAERAEVARFVHVSSIAAEWRGDAAYGSSKRGAEDVVGASELPWVMVRPPVILGPGSQVEAKIARFAKTRVVPTIAGSGTMFPVHVDDVAHACVEAAVRPGVCGRRYELPGPEALDLAEIQRRTLAALGTRAVVLGIPAGLLRRISDLLVLATGSTPMPAEVIDAIAAGVEMDGTAATRDLDFRPRAV